MLSDRSTIPPPDNPYAAGLIPKVIPPLPRENPHARHLPWHTAFRWLRQGWSDLWTNPGSSLLYGAAVNKLTVKSLIDGQEFLLPTGGGIYEGVAAASGSFLGQQVTGTAWNEQVLG